MRIWSRAVLMGVTFAFLAGGPPAGAAPDGLAGGASLDQILDRFEADDVPGRPPADVRLDAWVEGRADGARDVVIVIEPEGETKLIADPGITVSPVIQDGVDWRVPLPHRHVEAGRQYFEPSAAVRLPFEAPEGTPIDITVEYAYCLVDYQCFFGEEELTVANRID